MVDDNDDCRDGAKVVWRPGMELSVPRQPTYCLLWLPTRFTKPMKFRENTRSWFVKRSIVLAGFRIVLTEIHRFLLVFGQPVRSDFLLRNRKGKPWLPIIGGGGGYHERKPLSLEAQATAAPTLELVVGHASDDGIGAKMDSFASTASFYGASPLYCYSFMIRSLGTVNLLL